MRIAGWLIGLAVVTVSAVAPCAIAQDDGGMFTPRKPKAPERAPSEQPKPDGAELKPVEKQAGSWSIVLASFRGEKQTEAAREMLSKITEQKELAGAFMDVRGGGKATVVAVGKFRDPSGEDALAKLEKVRAIEVSGKKPFAGAFLAPPGELTDLGNHSEFNLSRAKELYGNKAQYTLQVGVYGRKDILDSGKTPTEADMKESRKLAEEAVLALRKEGELAFFYHGPRYSSVTIGVFDDKDFGKPGDSRTGEPARQENPALAALRLRFPVNLYNGAGVKVKTRDGKEEVQTSGMVRIPDR